MATTASSDILEWEAENRSRTAIAAIIGGNLIFFSGLGQFAAFNGAPRIGVLDGVRAAAGEPLASGSRGLLTPWLEFYDDRALGVTAAAIGSAIGTMFIALVLGYLFAATAARREGFPRAALYPALIGPVVAGVALIVSSVGRAIAAHDFISGSDHGTDAAHDAFKTSVIQASSVLQIVALLAIAFSFIFICINAMRVGLLTRFMGVLGAIVGVLASGIFPGLGATFVVEGFWLIATGLMLWGRLPSGRPPAWDSGVAVPWPTQQELREQRDAARGATAPAEAPVLPAAEAGDPPAKPHSASKKKKRKRR